MVLGAMLVAGALSLAVYNNVEDAKAGDTSKAILERLEKAIEENVIEEFGAGVVAQAGTGDDANGQTVREIEGKDSLVKLSKKTARPIELETYYYIGFITIPKLGISLPVQESWSDYNLRISPCRYSGDIANGKMIIAAHNYDSHFGRIKELSVGDEVIFTDTLDREYYFTVADTENISGSDPLKMESGDWALSLFTCTFDGSDRVTVRCIPS